MSSNPRKVLFVAGALMTAVWLAVLLAQWTNFDRAPLIFGLTLGGAMLLGFAFIRTRRPSA